MMVKTIVKATVSRYGVDKYSVHLTYKCNDGVFRDFTDCDEQTKKNACYILRKARTPIEGASYYDWEHNIYVETFDFMYDIYIGAIGICGTDAATMVNFLDTMISGCRNLDIQTNFILCYNEHTEVFKYKENEFVFCGDYLRQWRAL